MTIDHQIIFNEAKDYIIITLGLVLYSFGFTFFLMPYEIVTGGVAGVAAIVYYATGFPNSYTYFLINENHLCHPHAHRLARVHAQRRAT